MLRSLAGAAFATVQDYPSIAAGSCAFLVAFALVAGNALMGQPGGHPDPLWATRDGVTTQSVPGPKVPVRKVRTEIFAPVTIPVPEMRPPLASDTIDQGELVRRTQQTLGQLGLYDGKVDGKYGPVTRDAVLNFQRANGLKADGQVSTGLLAAAAEFAARAPRQNTSRQVVVRNDTARNDAPRQDAIAQILEGDKIAAAEPASTKSVKPADPTDNANVKLAQDSAEDIARSARIARIQIGLTNFGESGIAVDGVLGPGTVEAIRQFQGRYGLPQTGEPEEAVVHKLEQIGALQNS